ncbi:MAG: DUF512 domain-containing protein [Selenomonadaceae bacterium]|nr:DUF512 domain-containing protein [Selenomonadaceae bacterium]
MGFGATPQESFGVKMGFGKIVKVTEGGLAEELGLSAGDRILAVNDVTVRDLIEFSFMFADDEIDMLVEHEDGERELISFDKGYDEEIGAEFESAVDAIMPCKNHCVFCFVDMIAPNMRKSLSVKDDDFRLSFLYGNFITLTNMTDADYKRIEKYHLSPLYVSVQAINPEVRTKLLRTPRAANIIKDLERLENAGVSYHTQIVLCKGINDGEELERTIRELYERRPNVLSIAVVPVGVTKYRKDKFPLEQFDKDSAKKVIEDMEVWQEKFRNEFGETFLYLGDEFYITAEQEIPQEDYYDGYPQLENGIGLTRKFIRDFEKKLRDNRFHPSKFSYSKPYTIDVICGVSAGKFLKDLAKRAMGELKNLTVNVIPVTNGFFGERVNVSGLLTGKDILTALKNRPNESDGIIIPCAALRSGEEVFLDDYSLNELRAEFPNAKIEAVKNGGKFFKALQNFIKYKYIDNADAMRLNNAGYI